MGLHVVLTINIVLNNVKILGYFLTTDGISTTISPRAIMTGKTLNYKRCRAITFGQYFQTKEEDTPCNIRRPLTRDDICMDPSENNQGGFKFMTLISTKKLVKQNWDTIPMPDTVIALVNTIIQGQPNYL